MNWSTLIGFTVIFHGVVYFWRREWILRMDTQKFNSSINRISQLSIRKYFRIWFRLGSYVTILIGFPFTLWLFLRTIFYALFPTVISVASTISPSPSVISEIKEIELHHEKHSPFPDAEIISDTSHSSTSSGSYLAIQPILPGWNLPISQLPYYLIAILISVAIHELGHAIASASHRIPILSVGLSLFGPLIPTAHVELNSSQLRDTTFKKQLDILTAGVWMNFYLSLVCYFVMPKLIPAILWPTHSLNGQGLVVTGVLSRSGAGGPGGLERGDIITGVENCQVENLDTWLTCLENIWSSEPEGYCLTHDFISKSSNNSEGCCEPQSDNSPTHLCFVEIKRAEAVIQSVSALSNVLLDTGQKNKVEKEGASVNSPNKNNNKNNLTSHCLPAKFTLMKDEIDQNEKQKCFLPNYSCPSHSNSFSVDIDININKNEEEIGDGEIKNEEKDEENIETKRKKDKIQLIPQCFLPKIVREYEHFRIVQIHRRQHRRKEDVLFVGDVMDLVNGVRTSEFIPRDWFLSRLFGYSKFSQIPVEFETVLLLTAGLSAGLAVVNMLPIFGLDGYHIVDAIVRAFCTKWEPSRISKLVNFISWASVFLAVITILCSIFMMTN